MKLRIQTYLYDSINELIKKGILNIDASVHVSVIENADATYGNFSTNLAMVLGKKAGMSPRVLAEKIIEEFPLTEHPTNLLIQKLEIAGPGFINFYMIPGIALRQPYDYSADGKIACEGYLEDNFLLIKSYVPGMYDCNLPNSYAPNLQLSWDGIEDFGTSCRKEIIGSFESIDEATQHIQELSTGISYYLVKGRYVLVLDGKWFDKYILADKDFVYSLSKDSEKWINIVGAMTFTTTPATRLKTDLDVYEALKSGKTLMDTCNHGFLYKLDQGFIYRSYDDGKHWYKGLLSHTPSQLMIKP